MKETLEYILRILIVALLNICALGVAGYAHW